MTTALKLEHGRCEEAEDLVQECALRGWAGFEKFDHRQPFENWIYKLMLNIYARAPRARREVSLESLEGTPDEPLDNGARAEGSFALEDSIDRMRPRTRSAIKRILAGAPETGSFEREVRARARRELSRILLA